MATRYILHRRNRILTWPLKILQQNRLAPLDDADEAAATSSDRSFVASMPAPPCLCSPLTL